MKPVNEAKNPASVVSNKVPSKIKGLASKELLLESLALLKGLQTAYQTCHWNQKGYESHILFERLYESVEKEIDTLAEKIVGYYGSDSIKCEDIVARMHRTIKTWSGSEIDICVKAEKDFQGILKDVYDTMKNRDELSLGLDDFLMATASNHETNLYLLSLQVASE
jgi:DNA-binding ferritin-like protein